MFLKIQLLLKLFRSRISIPQKIFTSDYYGNNRNEPYCSFVIHPKIQKFLQKYSSKIKQECL